MWTIPGFCRDVREPVSQVRQRCFHQGRRGGVRRGGGQVPGGLPPNLRPSQRKEKSRQRFGRRQAAARSKDPDLLQGRQQRRLRCQGNGQSTSNFLKLFLHRF